MIRAENITNIEMIKVIAKRLGALNEEVVFLGGATTELLITDPAAPKTRVSLDVDVIIEIASLMDFYKLEEDLRQRGFTQRNNEDGEPICRWRIDTIMVDVMPTDPDILGFSNIWYSPAIKAATRYDIDRMTTIRLVTAPYFLATKIEAFYGRGNGDYLGSHDIEDLVALIDGRKEILDEIDGMTGELREYLLKEFDLCK